MTISLRTLPIATLTAACLSVGVLPASAAVSVDPAKVTWRELGGAPQSAVEQVGYLRAADGSLLMAWASQGTLLLSRVSAGSPPSAPAVVTSGWSGINTPAITQDPTGLHIFFGGIHSQSASDPNRDLNVATSTDGGATWTVQPGSVSAGGDYAYTSPITAVTAGPDGHPLEAWSGGAGLFVHEGVTSQGWTSIYEQPATAAILPRLVPTPNGGAAMAWLSSRPAEVRVQRVDPETVGPAGDRQSFPGLAQNGAINSMLNPVPLAARSTDGALFTTYRGGGAAGNTVRVWGVGQPTSQQFYAGSRGAPATHPTIAADPTGHLWLAYAAQHGPHGLALTTQRSAPGTGKATFGARVISNLPVPGFSNILGIEASPRGNTLDVIVTALTPADGAFHTFVGSVAPGLTLHTEVIPVGGGHLLHLRVTDAGRPVEGATVKVLGSTLKTAKDGLAVLVSTRSGRHTARAAKAGYVAATSRFRL